MNPDDLACEMIAVWTRAGALAYWLVRLTLVSSRREWCAWRVLAAALVRA